MNSSSAGHVRDLKEHVTITSRVVKPLHVNHNKSWVSPDAKLAPRLLFVSDSGTNTVNIYKMPTTGPKLSGVLTGFSEPQGMCSDAAGNVWVTNTGTDQIIQLSRTGSQLKTLTDPTGFPVGCAVNKQNGDLAVTNIIDSSANGEVLVYANATGTPEEITSPTVFEFFFPAYDNAGNLYADGEGSFGYALTELPAGSSTLTDLTVSGGTVFFPGGLNWDTSTSSLLLGDQECGGGAASCVYAATVSGGTATITGVTNLLDSSGGTAFDADQLTVAPGGRYLAGGTISEDSALSAANRWAYPAGGVPTSFNNSGLSEPIGAAISNK
jgi:DNA-binding beta-propeller fold protein YncE